MAGILCIRVVKGAGFSNSKNVAPGNCFLKFSINQEIQFVLNEWEGPLEPQWDITGSLVVTDPLNDQLYISVSNKETQLVCQKLHLNDLIEEKPREYSIVMIPLGCDIISATDMFIVNFWLTAVGFGNRPHDNRSIRFRLDLPDNTTSANGKIPDVECLSPSTSSIAMSKTPRSMKQCIIESRVNTKERNVIMLQRLWRRIIMRRRLSVLAKQARKMNRVAKELFDTETSYVAGLLRLKLEFVAPLASHHTTSQILPLEGLSKSNGNDGSNTPWIRVSDSSMMSIDTDFTSICGHIETIYNVHTKLLSEMRPFVEPKMKPFALFMLFETWSSILKLYIDYVVSYNQHLRLIEKTQTRKKYAFLFEDGCNQDLAALLITPIQRVPRYVLLLNDFIKSIPAIFSVEIQQLEKVLEQLQIVTTDINETKRQNEQLSEAMHIHASTRASKKLRRSQSQKTMTDSQRLTNTIGDQFLVFSMPVEVRSSRKNKYRQGTVFVFNNEVAISTIKKRGRMQKISESRKIKRLSKAISKTEGDTARISFTKQAEIPLYDKELCVAIHISSKYTLDKDGYYILEIQSPSGNLFGCRTKNKSMAKKLINTITDQTEEYKRAVQQVGQYNLRDCRGGRMASTQSFMSQRLLIRRTSLCHFDREEIAKQLSVDTKADTIEIDSISADSKLSRSVSMAELKGL